MNLIAGSTGFIGGHLVEYLFKQGEISKGIFRKGSYLKIMDAHGVQGIEADLLDHHSLHEAMEGVDVVYSLVSPMPDSNEDLDKVNTEGMVNLLEVASEMKVKKVVHLSTIDVYGFHVGTISETSVPSPENRYQAAKLNSEKILLDFARRDGGPRVAIIRAARAVGSRDRTLTVPLLRMIESGKAVLPSNTPMSFTHAKDIAQAMYKAASSDLASGRTFQIKSFDCTPEQVVRSLARALGRDVSVKKAGLLTRPELPSYTIEQLKAAIRLSGQEGWADLGYSPQYDLERTSMEIADWLRREPWEVESV